MGPIEILVVVFPGSQFAGGMVDELRKLVEAGTVAVVDGLFARRDADGALRMSEFSELGVHEQAAVFAGLLDRVEGLVSDEDVDELMATLEPGDSAVILVVEHLWSVPLRDAVAASGGVLAASVRVPAGVLAEVMAAVPDE